MLSITFLFQHLFGELVTRMCRSVLDQTNQIPLNLPSFHFRSIASVLLLRLRDRDLRVVRGHRAPGARHAEDGRGRRRGEGAAQAARRQGQDAGRLVVHLEISELRTARLLHESHV